MSLKASSGLNLEAFESNLSLISLDLIDLRNAWSCNKPENCLIPRSLSQASYFKSRHQLHREISPPEHRNDKLWQMPSKLWLRLMFHYIHVPQDFHLEYCFYKVWYWEFLTLLPNYCTQLVSSSVSNWIFFFLISSQCSRSPVLQQRCLFEKEK